MTVVLVVDDDPGSVLLLSIILKRSGFTVIDAANAEQGLELFYQRCPDLVMVDDMMPGMTGAQMCRQIKDNPSIVTFRWS